MEMDSSSASLRRTGQANAESADSRWHWLYRVSGAAALIGGVLFLIAVVDIIATSLQPGTAGGWLSLIGDNWLVLLFRLHTGVNGVELGQLYVLNNLDIFFMVLVAMMSLGLYAVLRRGSRVLSVIALVQPFLGIAIFIATQSAGRSAVMGAVLVMSFVMLRGRAFSNATAGVGILASVLLLVGDLSVSMAQSSVIGMLTGVGIVLLMTWLLLVARRLFALGQPV